MPSEVLIPMISQSQILELPQSQTSKINVVDSEHAIVADKPDDTTQSKEVMTGDQTTKPVNIDQTNPGKVTHIGTNLPAQ